MKLWWCCLTVLPALLSWAAAVSAADFEFVQRPGHCGGGNQRCISILNCPAYKTREDILRNRPTVCGFSGRGALICCDAAEPVTIVTPSSEEPVTIVTPSSEEPVTTVTPSSEEPVITVTPSSEEPVTPGSLTVTPSPLPQQCGEPRFVTQFTRLRRDATPELIQAETMPFEAGADEGPFVIAFVKQQLPISVDSVVGGEDVELVEHVIGGRLVVGHRWPWMVLFGRWNDTGLGGWFCGGTLITDRHVLTAAHCLRPEQAGTVGARIGDHDLRTPDEVNHQERNVSSIVQHPQYVGAQNDLALVRLDAPVELTFGVQPICLPPAGAEHDGQEVEIAGWGLFEFAGEPSDVLQEAPLRVTDPAACESAYRRVPTFNTRFPGGFQGTKICAGSRDDQPRDACRGDSGGPLMVQLINSTYQLVGVMSTGAGCGHPKFPGIYTKVSAYIDWIVSNLT